MGSADFGSVVIALFVITTLSYLVASAWSDVSERLMYKPDRTIDRPIWAMITYAGIITAISIGILMLFHNYVFDLTDYVASKVGV